jgi:hypothetical protein
MPVHHLNSAPSTRRDLVNTLDANRRALSGQAVAAGRQELRPAANLREVSSGGVAPWREVHSSQLQEPHHPTIRAASFGDLRLPDRVARTGGPVRHAQHQRRHQPYFVDGSASMRTGPTILLTSPSGRRPVPEPSVQTTPTYAEVTAGENIRRRLLRASPNRTANIFGLYLDALLNKGKTGEIKAAQRMAFGHRLLDIAEMLSRGDVPSIRQAKRLDKRLLGPQRAFGLVSLIRGAEARLSEMEYVTVCDYGMFVMANISAARPA